MSRSTSGRIVWHPRGRNAGFDSTTIIILCDHEALIITAGAGTAAERHAQAPGPSTQFGEAEVRAQDDSMSEVISLEAGRLADERAKLEYEAAQREKEEAEKQMQRAAAKEKAEKYKEKEEERSKEGAKRMAQKVKKAARKAKQEIVNREERADQGRKTKEGRQGKQLQRDAETSEQCEACFISALENLSRQ